MKKYWYSVILLLSITFIWYLMFLAKYEEYDTNYGLAIDAFVMSFVLLLLIVILWFTKRETIKSNKIITILTFITSSPISIILFIIIYNTFIGRYFKL